MELPAERKIVPFLTVLAIIPPPSALKNGVFKIVANEQSINYEAEKSAGVVDPESMYFLRKNVSMKVHGNVIAVPTNPFIIGVSSVDNVVVSNAEHVGNQLRKRVGHYTTATH